ncbi:MAG: glycosyltransferase family 39 protein [Ignavibacteria bacterium]|nr:glycosyltransferase family 39 protein [Ignavibacteria bacterium]
MFLHRFQHLIAMDTEHPSNEERGFFRTHWHLLVPATAMAVLLLATTMVKEYGFFIDEFYYIACAKRLAFGYVDHPPLTPLLMRISGMLLGYSLVAVRVLPALQAAATVFVTGLLARELGGKRTAQSLAAVALFPSVIFLVIFSFASVNATEVLLWLCAAFLLIRILRTERMRLWIPFGIVAGLGMINKHTFVLYLSTALLALLFAPQRRLLFTKEFWFGMGLMLLIMLPNIIWEAANDFLSLEFYRNAMAFKNVPTPPLEVAFGQVVVQNPLTLPLWLGGLWLLSFGADRKHYRPIALSFLFLFAIMLISQSSRPDRIMSAYPVLFAAGAVLFERATALLRYRAPLFAACTVLLLAAAVLVAPLSLPVLPPPQAERYAMAAGLLPQLERGEEKRTVLPQWLADRVGWEHFVAEVAAVMRALPESERRGAAIFAPNYGHAGALELWADRDTLPPVFCTHNTYWLWGRGRDFPSVLVVTGRDREQLTELFERVDQAAIIRTQYAMPWRRAVPVCIARNPRVDLKATWEGIREFE